MNEFIEKLIGRLEELANYNGNAYLDSADVFDEIKELAEEYKINTIIDGQYCWQTCGATEHCKECNRLCNGSIDYYENYESLAVECDNRWISVENALPKLNKVNMSDDVLISFKDSNTMRVGFYDGNNKKWFTYGSCPYIGEVIAWQPLPKYEPKGE